MKHITDELAQALVFAGVIRSKSDFSQKWLGMSQSYLSAIRAMENRDIGRLAKINLRSRIEGWLDRVAPQAGQLPLMHAVGIAKAVHAILTTHFEKQNSLEELPNDTHDRPRD